MNIWLFIAAISGFMAVLAGVFSAHGAGDMLGPENAERIATASRYQMYHALVLFCLVILAGQQRGWIDGIVGAAQGEMSFELSGALKIAAVAFVLGTVLFSICMYAYAATGFKPLARALPFGGLSFMAGWAALAWHALRGSGN